MRTADHAPLFMALTAREPFAVVFCFEPAVQASPTWDVRHWWFAYHSLLDMRETLRRHGIDLHYFFADALSVFELLHEKYGIDTIYSHQETGIGITYNRDKAVAAFCREKGILWQEHLSNGILRGGGDNTINDAKYRKEFVKQPSYEPHWQLAQNAEIDAEIIERLNNKPLPKGTVEAIAPFTPDLSFQKPGEHAAHNLLESFVNIRSRHYSNNAALCNEAHWSNSRLSAHLAFGNLSIRQLTHVLRSLPSNKNLLAFQNRLTWRGQYIQQFEREERLEFENFNFAYNGIRLRHNETLYQTWANGQTGIPIVDAAMRCVIQTGYLPFDLRAMLISVLTHHFWLDWRRGATHLAQQFLDFEPGIHFLQCQIQATCTGFHKIQVCDPIKMSIAQDPQGFFIKQWLPELAVLPTPLCHEPWRISALEQSWYGFVPNEHYRIPLIDLVKTKKYAEEQLQKIKSRPITQTEAQRLMKKHRLLLPKNEF